ncbi:MAG: hypothetical protein KF868_14850 [Acidobacteria bacterium]|nr:hypothetical protein [Acidobacteriota bacterium]MCW5970607.1 hypothetical protein [Blastocatellales bacterium]
MAGTSGRRLNGCSTPPANIRLKPAVEKKLVGACFESPEGAKDLQPSGVSPGYHANINFSPERAEDPRCIGLSPFQGLDAFLDLTWRLRTRLQIFRPFGAFKTRSKKKTNHGIHGSSGNHGTGDLFFATFVFSAYSVVCFFLKPSQHDSRHHHHE